MLVKGELGRSVLTLITGTTIAQAIPVVVSPILTRIYSPQDFALFALFTGVTSILSIVATGRYEQAVMLPRKDEDAAHIVVLSLIVSFLISLVLLAVAVIGNTPITVLLANPEISRWLYLVPVSVLLIGAYNAFNYWLNRQKQFRTMSVNRIIQGSLTASTQLGLGYVARGSAGLITGFIGGWFIAAFCAARSYNFRAFRVRLISIISHAKLYKDYPGLSAPSALLDSASIQTPVFFLSNGYEASTVGFFGLAMRALSAPASIISTSIGQVYFQKISILMHSDPESILPEVLRATQKLAATAAVAFIPLMFFGDRIFSFVFGQDWRVAGEYVQILSPALMMRFIVSPLSTVFPATGNVRLGALWQILYFSTSLLVMFILLGQRVSLFLTGFVINEIVMYSLYFYFIIRASKRVRAR